MNDRHDPSDFENRLGRHLRDEASRIVVPPGSPARAIGLAHRHRRRRNGAIVLGSVAALTAVSVTTLRVLDGSDGRRVVAGSDAGQAELVNGDLTWTTSPAPIGLGYGWSTARDGNTLYALSTEPGKQTDFDRPAAKMLYRSTDGSTWEPTPLPSDLSVGALAARSGTLYAVGTAPSTKPGTGDVPDPGEPVVATSVDGGRSWTRAALPIDLSRLQNNGVAPYVFTQIAAGPSGVVVLMNAGAQVDAGRLLPVGVDHSWGWRADASGITVGARPTDAELDALDGQLCGGEATLVVSDTTNSVGGHLSCDDPGEGAPPLEWDPSVVNPASGTLYSWTSLGVDGDLAALLSGQTIVFRSADGSAFERAGTLATSNSANVQGLVTVGDGFVASLGHYSAAGASVELLWSADGSTWSTTDTIDLGSGWPFSLVESNGIAVLIAQDTNGTLNSHTSRDGRSWTSTDMTGLLELPRGARLYVESAGSGPLGLVIAVAQEIDDVAAAGGVSFTKGGVTIRLENRTGNATVLAADGSVIATTSNIWYPTDTRRIRLGDVNPTTGSQDREILDADGTVIAVITDDDMNAALGTPTRGDAPAAATETTATTAVDDATNIVTTHFLLHTTDGVQWSKVAVADITGKNVGYVGNISVTTDRIIVRASSGSDAVLLVGTPKR